MRARQQSALQAVLGLGTGVKKLNARWHGVTDFGGPVRHMRERMIEELGLKLESVGLADLGKAAHFGKLVIDLQEGTT